MQPNKEFLKQPKHFWANIRTISQKVGYTQRMARTRGVRELPSRIKIPSIAEIETAFRTLDLDSNHLLTSRQKPTKLGATVLRYFEYRANVLNDFVEPRLMNADQAAAVFDDAKRRHRIGFSAPMNKQSGDLKKPAYFTGIINILIEQQLAGLPCNYNPQELTTITRNRQPFRTLARRVDGAFPGPVDPLAIWEIKEYYFTTTFGSRVADGVYETLLDGMELDELETGLRTLEPAERRRGAYRSTGHTRPNIEHLLMLDAHFTWWMKGRSYLCRIIDMLHMGYVDEVLFGREVLTRIPEIVGVWIRKYNDRESQ